MEYRQLGKTGLKVSAIGYGNWLNADNDEWRARNVKMVEKAWKLGINYFDTAELYGWGLGEMHLGDALKELKIPREQLVISTKIYWGPDMKINPNGCGLSHKHILEAADNCLKRIGIDYADIIFCHRFDRETPLREVCQAMDLLIKSKKCFYWGTSEWKASEIFEAFMICKENHLTFPVADQPQYHMFCREKLESDFERLFDHYQYGTTIFSPLAGGILTGKYNDGIPDDSRMKIFADNGAIARDFGQYFAEENKDKYIKALKALGDIAKSLGCTQAQLAMAWVLKYPWVSTAITGASKESQLEDVVQAINVQKLLTPEILAKIEEILGNS